ncbi:MAG: hypothetical protein JOZ96_09780 [Acidobacteria bacterium]|nr:hypothetical protein [Acidobacteriota bacterium]MBV9070195.1 hypothetical protein [Acidobacteriota bacterium]MBV9185599.1 hypothetical protein [Acidobacteriota bacterium]MBV9925291.1 hypothetical protein [Acidobacteriota bacterium]
MTERFTSPLEAFLGWLETRPSDVKWYVSLQIITNAPTGVFSPPAYDDVMHPDAVVRSRIQRGEETTRTHVELTALLRRLTERAMVSRSTVEDWTRAYEMNVEFSETHSGAPPAEDVTRSFEFRSKMWIREYEEWSELRDSRLSDTAMDAWEKLVNLEKFLQS